MQSSEKGLIAWFARNSVAANLLMLFIIVGGLLASLTIRKQMFPLVEINWLNINVPYPGAAPQEVEEGITIKIEEALEGIEGLKRVISYSNRGSSSAWIEVDTDYDTQEVLDEVKLQIDSIPSFPDGMERPIVKREKFRQEVMYISLHGDLTPKQLKELGRGIHDEIQDLSTVNISNFYGGLSYEISIEVSQDKLREYQLSFRDIASTIRNYSANMSAGQIRAQNGVISMRVENQAYTEQEFAQLPLITRDDGTVVLLGDIATIHDGFVEGLHYSKFNGENAVTLFVGASSDQSISGVADQVKAYIEEKQTQLPQGVSLTPWVDMTFYLNGRLDMMLSNMFSGGVLVFLMLALFLRIRLAFWVMMGLPVSFLGALFFMPMEFINVTINVTSLFAFILVLGVVVDDAIVVGESASDEIERHGHSLDNVVRGVKRVAMPATFGVLTTIAAFLPMLFSDGPESAMAHSIGYVVVLCLLFSLVESKLILPAHLAKIKYKEANDTSKLHAIRLKVDGGLKRFVANTYQPFLIKAVHYRYTVLVTFIGILLISAGLFIGGLVRFIGMPQIPHDFPRISIEMKQQSSEQSTLDAILAVENVIKRVDKEIEQEFGHRVVGEINSSLDSRTRGQVMVKMIDPELRTLDTFQVAQRWRDAMPPMAGLKSLTVSDNLFGGGRDDGDVSFSLMGKNDDELLAAAKALKAKLRSLKGVSDVNDSRQSATKEVQFELTPLAYGLGLTLRDIASQVNFSFYGIEAQRILRDSEEIRVMLRYPQEQRSSIGHINDTLIFTKDGQQVPLSELATVTLTDGVNRIRRENGKRTVNVWATVDSAQVETFKVAEDIRNNFMPELLKLYPSVKTKLSGRIQQEMDGANEQLRNFVLSLLVIFALLAVPLRSYSQPLIIMSVIPFGVIGAVIGHMIFGLDLSSMSMFGIIAAAGVVVNDSLVMVDFVNKARERGARIKDAVIEAGGRRFRAIALTSLTTFIGLMPIIFETSMQAKIVIPMAISLAFGVAFATVITLLLIPCLYVILEDIKGVFSKTKRAQLQAEKAAALNEASGEVAITNSGGISPSSS
ncbi:efflux RND transporter permease subunit [Psychrobium sp. 1_MG-2023]|uniref:efflux RND transporter permease subunit n=1 Tax=Psychrobium sp. 1_MG-2023 TaxID=3062624 RepID=UPI000C32885E|nr:efflux RND transporter permease subunit [Psychrobium sp. 1_MG-2023]MDP2562257.1 efflux RND transporter permease subunit [Psychrobium sp. 1_MG-2023]PKF57507.1 acriflavin resistance protein [Alteromonadales bacterium alter-6D02]